MGCPPVDKQTQGFETLNADKIGRVLQREGIIDKFIDAGASGMTVTRHGDETQIDVGRASQKTNEIFEEAKAALKKHGLDCQDYARTRCLAAPAEYMVCKPSKGIEGPGV
jgi:hypothetical protein